MDVVTLLNSYDQADLEPWDVTLSNSYDQANLEQSRLHVVQQKNHTICELPGTFIVDADT